MSVHENTLRRGAVAVLGVARAELGHPIGRALLGLMFVLACLPYEQRALSRGDRT